VYDAKAKDNELKSAELFKDFCKDMSLMSAADESIVCEWILATADHTSAKCNANSDQSFFLDFDLAILGETPSVYEKYCADIRKEYSHVPDEAFRVGRSNVLKRFLQSNRLFRTDLLTLVFEAQARSNIQLELNRLEIQQH